MCVRVRVCVCVRVCVVCEQIYVIPIVYSIILVIRSNDDSSLQLLLAVILSSNVKMETLVSSGM